MLYTSGRFFQKCDHVLAVKCEHWKWLLQLIPLNHCMIEQRIDLCRPILELLANLFPPWLPVGWGCVLCLLASLSFVLER